MRASEPQGNPAFSAYQSRPHSTLLAPGPGSLSARVFSAPASAGHSVTPLASLRFIDHIPGLALPGAPGLACGRCS